MSDDPLEAREEDEDEESQAQRGGGGDALAVEPEELEDRDYGAWSENGSDVFESADEGEDGAWTSGKRASKRFSRRGSRDKLSSIRPTLSTIPDHTLTNPSIRPEEEHVSFDTTQGGLDDPPPEEDSPTSLKQLVRQSWRLSKGGSHDCTPAHGKRTSQRVTATRYGRDNPGDLPVAGAGSRRRSLNSYAFSPLPVVSPKSPERLVASSRRPSPNLPALTPSSSPSPPSPPPSPSPILPPQHLSPPSPSPSQTHSFSQAILEQDDESIGAMVESPSSALPEAFAPSTDYDSRPPTPIAIDPSPSVDSINPLSRGRPRATSQGHRPAFAFLDSKPLGRPSGRSDSAPKGRVVSEPTLTKSKSAVRLAALFNLGRSRSNSKDDGVPDFRADPPPPLPPLPLQHARRRAFSVATSRVTSTPAPTLPPKTPATPSKVSPLPDIPSTPPPPPPSGIGASPFSSRTWRSTIDAVEYESLSARYGPLEMRRQEVIWELCETEKAFVTSLRGVLRIFSLPLRPSGSWIEGVPMGVSRLFDWLDDIIFLHAQISDALESARIPNHPVLNVAEAILPLAARLDVHLPYLVRLEAVTKGIDEMTADASSDFGEFVRMQSGLPECAALSLGSFLLKPVQRLMKYPLFFKQLCNLTPPNHPDHLPLLSLLNSTDSTIRVMQEVKSREDEYDEAESLQSRIRGLPDGFQLARRDRRLIAQGLVHQVHLRPKDRALLELDALVRVAAPRRKASDASLLSPIITSSSIPTPEGSRPHSEVSDSGSSGRSAGSRSFSDADASSGWISPPTPDSFTVPSHQGLNTSKPPGLDSSFSSSFHRLRTESLVSEFGEDPSLAAFESSSTTSRKVVKGKAKETPLYAFVFSDLVVLARKKEEGGRFKRSSTSSRKSEANYKVVETIGLSRVLGVSDLSGKTVHDHLIEIHLLPLPKGDSPTSSFLSSSSLSTSIYLTLPSPLHPDLRLQEHARWLAAFERSYRFVLRALSFPNTLLSIPVTPEEHANAEREGAWGESGEGGDAGWEEKRFWGSRLRLVRREMEGRNAESRRRRSEGG